MHAPVVTEMLVIPVAGHDSMLLNLSVQNKTLQQQQSLLAEQIQKLQAERDDATNQLGLVAETQTQNQNEHSELLRLRGEQAQMEFLRQQLAQLKSSRNPSAPAEAATDVSGPNKVLYDFLGEPASPPPDLNPAWTKAGLMEGVQLAAQNAGVTLKKVEIDDSEFPYLVGIVCKKNDFEKLTAQFKKNPVYEYSGSVGGPDYNAFNITPDRAFLGQAGVSISRRMIVRESMLSTKLAESSDARVILPEGAKEEQ